MIANTFKKNLTYNGKLLFYSILKDIRKNRKKESFTYEFKQFKPFFPKEYAYYKMLPHVLNLEKLEFFKKIEVDKNKKTYAIYPHEKLRELLVVSDESIKIDIEILKNFRRIYSFRAYEYFSVYEDEFINKKLKIIELKDFKSYFDFGKTIDISSLYNNILIQIIKDINEHTQFNIKEIKRLTLDPYRSHKITHLFIDIEYKE